MSGSHRILFQSHNRRGLGHLMRALNVAHELRSLAPDARIVLHTRNPSTARFCPGGIEWVLDTEGGTRNWHATIRELEPTVVVYDTMIPVDPASEPLPMSARVAYVMRRCTDERHEAILASPFLDRVDVGIVPHDPAEFDQPIPAHLADRMVFTGPIVRSPEPARMDRLRRRYELDGASRVVVSSAGGGGFAETAGPFFDAVWRAHERMVARIPRLRHIVVLGPHNQRERAPLPGMRVVESEPDLVDLFALADLVVSEGGYNSVNEIRLVGVPACYVPGRRRWDDQDQRVRALEAAGVAAVVEPGAPGTMGQQIAALAGDGPRLDELRRCSVRDGLTPGNRRAAEAILAGAAT